jgi:5'-3' exonuclease
LPTEPQPQATINVASELQPTPKVLLVDINVLGIGSMRQWAYASQTHGGQPTGAIHGTLDKLAALAADFPDHVPVILWDDRCRWREAILPTYKRHRWASPEQQAFLQRYLAQAAVVRELLAALGVLQVFCPDFEADDLAGLLCREFYPTWPVVLATSDSDWFQALRDNVTWYSPSSGRHITVDDLGDTSLVKDGPFLSTDHYVRAKALAGDATDGIDGITGVGLKTAAKILREHDGVETLWAHHDSGREIRGVALRRAAGPDYRDTYRRNLQLIDWRRAPPLPGNHAVTGAPGDLARYATLCADWGLVEEPCALATDTSGIVRDAVERAIARQVLR